MNTFTNGMCLWAETQNTYLVCYIGYRVNTHVAEYARKNLGATRCEGTVLPLRCLQHLNAAGAIPRNPELTA